MNLAKNFLSGIMVLCIGVGLVFAQGEEGAGAVNPELKDLDVQWILGEVINVNPENKVINVKYLDYIDSQEKEMLLVIDATTTYENIKSLDEIKPQDSLSIDYMVTQDGKNVARNIGSDKPKESEVVAQAEAAGEPEIAQ